MLRNRELLTCSSAAPHYNLWCLQPPVLRHVYHQRQTAVRDHAIHHAGLLLPPSPLRPVASLADVVVHALRCLPFPESLVMVECAVSKGERKARAVLDWVDRGSDPLLETLARTYFRQAGISVQTQFYLERVGYVDLLLDGWLLVELDGRHHAGWNPVQKDHRRNNESVVQGYTALRYYYSDVVYHPEAMVAQVLTVLERRRQEFHRHAEQAFAARNQQNLREIRKGGALGCQKCAPPDAGLMETGRPRSSASG